MNRFEDELRRALQREEPPEGFTESVLARAASLPRRAIGRWGVLAGWLRPPAWRVAAVAAGLLLVVGTQQYRARQSKAEGEMARERLMLALQITGSKLQVVQQKVHQLSVAASEREDGATKPAVKIL